MKGTGKSRTVVLALLILASAVSFWVAKEVLPERWYLRQLCSTDRDERKAAAEALAGMQSEKAVPCLLELIGDPGPDSPFIGGNYAQQALTRIGEPAIPALLGALRGKRVDESCCAEVLDKRLEDDLYRMFASQVIVELGTAAADAVPGLLTMLRSPEVNDRHTASLVVGHLSAAALDRHDERFAKELGEAAVPILATLLGDDDPAVRTGASYALSQMESEAAAAVTQLLDALEDSDVWVRRNAAEALGNLPAYRTQSVEPLTRLLEDESRNEDGREPARYAAAWALFRLGEEPVLYLPVLRAMLRSDYSGDQAKALVALGEIGPDAGDASHAVRRLTTDTLVGDLAKETLEKITTGAGDDRH